MKELRQRLSGVKRNTAGRRLFDDELRSEVVAYVQSRVDQGASQTEATKELDLDQRTVWGWMQTKSGAVVREVEVIEHEAREPRPERTFELRLPSGASIGGLTLDDIAALLRSAP